MPLRDVELTACGGAGRRAGIAMRVAMTPHALGTSRPRSAPSCRARPSDAGPTMPSTTSVDQVSPHRFASALSHCCLRRPISTSSPRSWSLPSSPPQRAPSRPHRPDRRDRAARSDRVTDHPRRDRAVRPPTAKIEPAQRHARVRPARHLRGNRQQAGSGDTAPGQEPLSTPASSAAAAISVAVGELVCKVHEMSMCDRRRAGER